MIYNFFFILLGFIFTFFIPGYTVIELFYPELEGKYKFPLYLFCSLIFSTYLIYFLGLILAYDKYTVILSYLIWAGLFLFLIARRRRLSNFLNNYPYSAILFFLFVLILFFVSLYPAIFYPYKDFFVMSADNWQDTAMHMSIIQSISQGNFPPQAPYFSGVPLSYYYLADFHTAIITTLSSGFVPRILILDNSIFALMFSISVYALSFFVTKNKRIALISSILATFSGSFIFLNFLRDFLNGKAPFMDLLATGGYSLEFGKIYGVTPMVDYFLQNRPMMVGLPGIAIIVFLIVKGFVEGNKKIILLAGILTGFLLKFQIFAFGSIVITFFIASLCFFHIKSSKQWLKLVILFLIPMIGIVVILNLIFPTSVSVFHLFSSTFASGPWDKTKDIVWYVKFIVLNIGILFGTFLIFMVLIFFKRVSFKREWLFLIVWGFLIFSIPFTVRFTIYEGDMFKFFYIATIPFAVISSIVFSKMLRSRVLSIFLVIIVICISFTSFLTLAGSFFNRNFAYSMDDYVAGIWIRNNTPQKSIFIEMPKVHSPASDIGGRLRILSYITWPYSHGFNEGQDNVFSRLDDIKNFYNNPNLTILRKYSVNYVYLGLEETNNYPKARELLDRSEFLKKIYAGENTAIYKINI